MDEAPDKWKFWLIIVLVALAALSEHLAFNRIFQVDELQYIFTARLLATHQAAHYAVSANLMLLGPMTWIAGSIDNAALLLRCERLLFLGVFWLNLCLIVHCAGLRLSSRKGLVALILVALLVPLWDYGFEIRHDNALLTAILLTWSFARALGGGKRRLAFVGASAVIAQFIAFKAFAYVAPIVVFAVAAAVWEDKRKWWRAVGELLAGAAAALIAAVTAHWLAGTWSAFSSDTRSLGAAAVHATVRFLPWPTLWRVVVQSPMLVIGVVIAAVVAVRAARVNGLFSRESLLPELGLVILALATLFVNRTPFPYNVVLFVPQAAILCLRLEPLACRFSQATAAVLVVIHLACWIVWMPRHLQMTNERQMELATTAERLTDPVEHAVFDGSGLVPTRHPPGRNWLIHTFTIDAFRNGTFPPIRAQLAEGRTPVIIPNYRTSWLPAEDHQYIRQHYVPLAGDLLVAGTVLTGAGTAQWDCPVAGRYYVAYGGSHPPPALDGKPLARGIAILGKGPHTFESGGGTVYVVWVGPTLGAPPAIGPGDASRVFVNWY